MTKDATKHTFVKLGDERVAVQTLTPTCIHHAYGREKSKLNVYANNFIFHTIGTLRAGSSFWPPAAMQPYNPSDRNESRRLSNCFGIARPDDHRLRKLSALVRCKTCGIDAWDILTLLQKSRNCPFCVTGHIPLSKELTRIVSNASVVREEVLPVLRANAMIANGNVVTTARWPIPADWKITALPDAHLDNILFIFERTAPEAYNAFLKDEASVRHRIRRQFWCPSRNLSHLMPPEPVPDNDLVPWEMESQHTVTTLHCFSQDQIVSELMCPEDCAQIQCGDWSRVGGPFGQCATRPVFNAPWARFAADLSPDVPTRKDACEYIRRAKLTADVYRASMTRDRNQAEARPRVRAQMSQIFQSGINRYAYTSPEIMICGGLGSCPTPLSKTHVNHSTRVVQATCCTRIHGKVKKVHGTSGRTPEKEQGTSQMVSVGYTPRDAINQLLIDALAVRNKDGASVIVHAFLGLSPELVENFIDQLRESTCARPGTPLFTDPHRAMVYQFLIPTWLCDHDSATLISMAMYLTQSGSNCIDIVANSAGSMAAAAWTAIINQWPENMPGCEPVIKCITTTVMAASLAPHHLTELCSSDGTTLSYITCNHDMCAPCGDPGPGMKRAAEAAVHLFPALPTQVHPMRIYGEAHLLQAAFGSSMHNVGRLVEHATGGNTTHFLLSGGTFSDDDGNISIDDLKTRMPIGDDRMIGMKESIFALTLITNATSWDGHFNASMAQEYLNHTQQLRLQITVLFPVPGGPAKLSMYAPRMSCT